MCGTDNQQPISTSMKYFLLIGGFCGFTTAFVAGIAGGNDLAYVLRNACIGCVFGAMLMRGMHALMSYQVRQLAQQQAAAKHDHPTSGATPSRA